MNTVVLPVLTVRGSGSQRTFAAGHDVVIGRDLRADMRITHQLISRTHLLLRFDQGRWLAIDNCSCHGTFVKNRRVQVVDIYDGQTINIGKPDGPWLTFELGRHPEMAGPATANGADPHRSTAGHGHRIRSARGRSAGRAARKECQCDLTPARVRIPRPRCIPAPGGQSQPINRTWRRSSFTPYGLGPRSRRNRSGPRQSVVPTTTTSSSQTSWPWRRAWLHTPHACAFDMAMLGVRGLRRPRSVADPSQALTRTRPAVSCRWGRTRLLRYSAGRFGPHRAPVAELRSLASMVSTGMSTGNVSASRTSATGYLGAPSNWLTAIRNGRLRCSKKSTAAKLSCRRRPG